MNTRVIDWRTLGLKEGHECEFMGDESADIYKDKGKWWFNIHEETEAVIYYCPYCAEKLE